MSRIPAIGPALGRMREMHHHTTSEPIAQSQTYEAHANDPRKPTPAMIPRRLTQPGRSNPPRFRPGIPPLFRSRRRLRIAPGLRVVTLECR